MSVEDFTLTECWQDEINVGINVNVNVETGNEDGTSKENALNGTRDDDDDDVIDSDKNAVNSHRNEMRSMSDYEVLNVVFDEEEEEVASSGTSDDNDMAAIVANGVKNTNEESNKKDDEDNNNVNDNEEEEEEVSVEVDADLDAIADNSDTLDDNTRNDDDDDDICAVERPLHELLDPSSSSSFRDRGRKRPIDETYEHNVGVKRLKRHNLCSALFKEHEKHRTIAKRILDDVIDAMPFRLSVSSASQSSSRLSATTLSLPQGLVYHCTLCQMNLQSERHRAQHERNPYHLEQFQLAQKEGAELESSGSLSPGLIYRCKYCGINLKTERHRLHHEKSPYHIELCNKKMARAV